jgi:drug/metabolite transporter (DMT)-like permease
MSAPGHPMNRGDLGELLLLAALWGASFLFMRMGASVFGPVALVGLRVMGAALFLLPLLAWRGQLGAMRTHWRPILVVGITNSALPFLLFTTATLAVTGGLASVFNATTPLWGALIGWWWLKDRPTPYRLVGLVIGFAGVFWLAYDKIGLKAQHGGISPGLAVLACMAAATSYGFSANFTKRHLTGVPSLALATGSQVAASLVLIVPTVIWWPAVMPDASAWTAAALLAIVCTGMAYVLFFRLIANVGPANAISVTFLIPGFAVLWGWWLLDEGVGLKVVLACAVILLGTGLVTGLIKPRVTRPAS